MYDTYYEHLQGVFHVGYLPMYIKFPVLVHVLIYQGNCANMAP